MPWRHYLVSRKIPKHHQMARLSLSIFSSGIPPSPHHLILIHKHHMIKGVSPPCFPWRQLFLNPWMLRCSFHTHSFCLGFIWLGLGRIKRRPAIDSPEVKAERRQFLQHHPPVWGKDSTKPNGTPQEAAISLWTPFKK